MTHTIRKMAGRLLAGDAAGRILGTLFRNRIPFVGPSSAWVKAGAIYALDWDFADIGQQCGGIALKIFKGVRPEAIPVEGPRRVIYTLNEKTAAHMKIEIPAEVSRRAQRSY